VRTFKGKGELSKKYIFKHHREEELTVARTAKGEKDQGPLKQTPALIRSVLGKGSKGFAAGCGRVQDRPYLVAKRNPPPTVGAIRHRDKEERG